MDSAQSFITSSWTFRLRGDDGKIVTYQSKPEIQYAPQLEQEPADVKESSLSKMSYLPMRSSQAHRGYLEDGESEDGFSKCLSLTSGWILTTSLVFLVMVLPQICCVTAATAGEQCVP